MAQSDAFVYRHNLSILQNMKRLRRLTDLDYPTSDISGIVEVFAQPVQVGCPIHSHILKLSARGTAHPLRPGIVSFTSSQQEKAPIH